MFVVLTVIFMCICRTKMLRVLRRTSFRSLGGRTLNYAVDLNCFHSEEEKTLNYLLYCCLLFLFNSLHFRDLNLCETTSRVESHI